MCNKIRKNCQNSSLTKVPYKNLTNFFTVRVFKYFNILIFDSIDNRHNKKKININCSLLINKQQDKKYIRRKLRLKKEMEIEE